MRFTLDYDQYALIIGKGNPSKHGNCLSFSDRKCRLLIF